MKKIFSATVLATALLSANLYAAPTIIYKDMTATPVNLKDLPSEMNTIVRDINANEKDLREIVVHKFADHYVIFLLSNKVWGMQKIRVDFNAQGKAQLTKNYSLSEKYADEYEGRCPDRHTEVVVISAYPNVGAVNDAIKLVSENASKKFKTTTILDEKANAKVYKDWLACPHLKAFYSISHGSSDGIMVGQGEVISVDFFENKQFMDRFRHTTLVFNACQVFNFPFGTEIMYGNAMRRSDFKLDAGPHAYEFIGGHTNLLMVSSELASACLLSQAFEGAKMNYDTLNKCIGENDLLAQNFGISKPDRKMHGV